METPKRSKVYFSFAIADSMFDNFSLISKYSLTIEEVHEILENEHAEYDVVSCVNPSHTATISAMKQKYNIVMPIPDKAPIVHLEKNDDIVVMSVRGLPRMEGRHEYTVEEIESAEFAFSIYHVHDTKISDN